MQPTSEKHSPSEEDQDPVQFKSNVATKVFNFLIDAFIEDYMAKKYVSEKSGWRTLAEIATRAHLSPSLLYGKHSTISPALDEPIRRGLIETRIFPRERGRGGEIMRLRIAYDKEPIREFVNKKVLQGPGSSPTIKTMTEQRISPPQTLCPQDRVAVLPFVSISPDPSDEYFADGLTEELISKLSAVPGLKVIARTSVMSYKKKDKSVSEIASELGVGTMVEGSVRKTGDRIRATVQLINANTEEHIWASSYDRKLDDIFDVQTEMASKIIESIPAMLAQPTFSSYYYSHKRESAERETRDFTAYTYFLHGKQLLHERTEDSLRRALVLFENAKDRDPNFARAYVGMADCYFGLANAMYDPYIESIERAEDSLRKALRVDRKLAEAHSTFSLLRFALDDRAGAESEAKEALKQNANLPDPYWVLSFVEASKGNLDASIKLLEAGYQLDPLDPRIAGLLGQEYFWRGREADALEHWKKISIVLPFSSHVNIAEYHLTRGELEQSSENIRRLVELRPRSPRVLMLEGYLAALRGDREKAMEFIRALEETSKEGDSAAINLIGFVYYALGEIDTFFEYMFRASKVHALSTVWILYSPLFRNARKDPRWAKLFKELGIDVADIPCN